MKFRTITAGVLTGNHMIGGWRYAEEEAQALDVFCFHKNTNEYHTPKEKWVVTHIPSGFLVAKLSSQAKAKALTEYLEAFVTTDWEPDTEEIHNCINNGPTSGMLEYRRGVKEALDNWMNSAANM